MAKKRETRFKEQTIDPFLKALPNTYVHKTQEIAKRGVPDYELCINGMFVGMEVKVDGEKPNKLQQYKLNQIQNAKGIALAVMPSTWEATSKILTILAHEPSSKERVMSDEH